MYICPQVHENSTHILIMSQSPNNEKEKGSLGGENHE